VPAREVDVGRSTEGGDGEGAVLGAKGARIRGETDPKRLERLAAVSKDGPSKLGAFRRAYSSKSLRAAVSAFCLECLWLDPAAIRGCTATACPLWNVRPYQSYPKEREPASDESKG